MKNKKSFIAYCDWKETFEALPDEKAGQLIKHIFSYVSDENPQTDDVLIKAVFANIKNTLKRDLEKWEKQHQQRIDAGKRSAELRKRNSTTVERPLNETEQTSTVSVSDSVNDNVSVTVNDNVSDNVNVNTKKEKKKPNGSKETLLFKNCKSEFLETYQHLTGNEYYFNAKDAGNLKPLINKLKHSIKEKKEKDSAQKEKNATDEEVITSLRFIMENVTGWHKENLSIPILNSKYNEIINQLRNGKGSTIKQAHDIQAGLARIDAMPD